MEHDCRVDWINGLFAAVCSCGWRGPEREKLAEADKDGDQHLGLIGA